MTRKVTGNKNYQITVEAPSQGIRINLSMLITSREDIIPLLGMDWLRRINLTIRHVKMTTTLIDQSERDEVITQFEKLFKRNRTIKDTEMKLQLKSGLLLRKQKVRPVA